MATKVVMSEKEFKEKVGKQCEEEFARLSNGLFNQITTKYEDMIKEQTKSEIDKVNDSIKAQCPTNGALVLMLDRNEITVPFTDTSKVYITGFNEASLKGEEDYKTLELTKEHLIEDNLLDIMGFIKSHYLVKIRVITGRDVELYNKELFESEGKVEKENHTYETDYCTVVNPLLVSSLYLVNAELK